MTSQTVRNKHKIRPHNTHELPDAANVPTKWVRDTAWELVQRCDRIHTIETMLNVHPGRNGSPSFVVLCYGIMMLALQNKDLQLRQVWCTLRNLPTNQQRALGIIDPDNDIAISYDQTTHRFARGRHIVRQVDHQMRDADDLAVAGWLVEQIAERSIPDDMPPPTSMMALDSTDIETWGRTSFERIDGDWKPFSPTDIDARGGHRPSRNGRKAGVNIGFDQHFFVDTIVGNTGDPQPRFIRSCAFAPANTPAGAVTLAAMKRLHDKTHFTDLVADRGYSRLDPDNWFNHVNQLGINVTIDLIIHDPQRNRLRGIYDGALLIDGRMYSPSMPNHLRFLPAHHKDLTAAQHQQLAEQYDLRKPYAFIRNKSINPFQTRWIAPCQRGKIRCPLVPSSMRNPTDRPTNHPSETPDTDNKPTCCMQTSITVPLEAFEGKLQKHAYGGTKWTAIYYQRNQVETANSNLKYHRFSMRRGTIRLRGAYANAILIAFAVAAVNILTAREWRRRSNMTEPHPDPTVEHERARLARRRHQKQAAMSKPHKTRKRNKPPNPELNAEPSNT